MPSEKADKARNEMGPQEGASLIEQARDRVSRQLQNARQRIHQEIKSYPTPIPACDAQFNYLLEERSRIAAEMARFEAIPKAGLSGEEHIRSIEEFITWSKYIDNEEEKRIRTSLLKAGEGGA